VYATKIQSCTAAFWSDAMLSDSEDKCEGTPMPSCSTPLLVKATTKNVHSSTHNAPNFISSLAYPNCNWHWLCSHSQPFNLQSVSVIYTIITNRRRHTLQPLTSCVVSRPSAPAVPPGPVVPDACHVTISYTCSSAFLR